MSTEKAPVTVTDLVEEAKKRIVLLTVCVVGLSYLMSCKYSFYIYCFICSTWLCSILCFFYFNLLLWCGWWNVNLSFVYVSVCVCVFVCTFGGGMIRLGTTDLIDCVIGTDSCCWFRMRKSWLMLWSDFFFVMI